MVNMFVKSLQAKNRSESTVSMYQREVESFRNWCKTTNSETDYALIGIRQLNEYVDHLCEMGNSPATRCQKISALKTFWRWMYQNELVDTNVAEKLEKPTIEKKTVKTLSIDEVSLAKAECFEKKSGQHKAPNFRNRLIFQLFLNCGLRRAEMVNLRLSDIDFIERRLLIHGKGNKQRYAYFNQTTDELLKAYLSIHRQKMDGAANSNYVFVSNKQQKLDNSTINKAINEIFESSGLKAKGYTVHTLRKTCATLLYNNGADVSVIKDVLGHSRLETTFIYLSIGEEQKRTATANMEF